MKDKYSDLFNHDHKAFAKYSPAIAKKINRLILDIMEHPETGIGKPERLKGYGELQYYSRRIDEKNRLIYEIIPHDETIAFLSCKGHYDDN